ncbi:MAG: NAD-dependent DNA ligase LigA, partial [Verrucomicrobia bacterium]|nr:NAD-dependent DNA ligase LigA [Verrucomicrobiota bacterium]
KGQFVRAVTRGNGARGDDVTANVSLIREIPRTLKGAPDLLEVRGEIYMELAEFQRLNQLREAEGEPLYANPRNLAAGTVKLLDGEEARKRRLSIVCYGLGACEPASVFPSLKDFKNKLKAWGFPIRDDIDVQQGVDAAWKAIQQLDVLRRDLPFPTDGAVVKVNRLEDQRRAGTTSKFPHWAVAFKFPPDQATTILRKISMQVGRTGAITPVAELDPVLLAGSTVARATLHNASEIAKKGIREGDTVRIQKAGEIIPQVLGVVLEKRPADAQPFDFEARRRGSRLQAPGSVARDEDPPARPLRQQAVPRHRRLGRRRGRTARRPRPRQRSRRRPRHHRRPMAHARRLQGQVRRQHAGRLEQAKQRELWRAIHALGIPNVGMQTAKDLARHFKSMDELEAAQPADLLVTKVGKKGGVSYESVISGVGIEVSESILSFFSDPNHRDWVKAMRTAGLNLVEAAAAGSVEGVAGKTFVLTGTLPTLGRDEARD